MYLLDTIVLSELRKKERCDPHVRQWFLQIPEHEVFVSVLAIGEIRQEIERLRRRNPHGVHQLEGWLHELLRSLGDRLLPVDKAIAQRWGRINAHHQFFVVDALMAATAAVHDLTFVTRNAKDVERSGVSCFNPFED
ncbi:MAG TPA: type II toxin-antitoxin system VapC family toxin [Candidatus Binataceae bacterium]|nr:type II toxin-antitoxin system VapC family toxin [Candidatus Binataceae bacterium]